MYTQYKNNSKSDICKVTLLGMRGPYKIVSKSTKKKKVAKSVNICRIVEVKKSDIPQQPKFNVEEYDVYSLDSAIKAYLLQLCSCESVLKKKLDDFDVIKSIPENKQHFHIIGSKIRKLKEDINNIKNDRLYWKYIFRSTKALDDYVKTKSKLSRLHFLSIARDFITLENHNACLPDVILCSECKTDNYLRFDQDDSVAVCSRCQSEVPWLDLTLVYKDSERVNISSKYTYSRKSHFLEACLSFQGLQKIDKDTLESLLDILKKEIAVNGLTTECKKDNTVQKKHIRNFLNEKKLSKYYEDVYLLHNILTGEPCNDISHVQDDLCKDYEELEPVLCNIIRGPNAPNIYYQLLKLLQKRGLNYKKNDFFFLKSKSTLDEHDEDMEKAWGILGWEWIPTM